MHKKAFRDNCPTLHRIATVYEEHAKSYVLMLTWQDGLWMHADLRASWTSQRPEDEDSTRWKWRTKSHADGKGPKDGTLVVGHSIAGDEQVVAYANTKNPMTSDDVLRMQKWPTPSGALSYSRLVGFLSAMPCWLHCGAAVLALH